MPRLSYRYSILTTILFWPFDLMNPSIIQSINQSIHLSTNRSINQSINQSIAGSMTGISVSFTASTLGVRSLRRVKPAEIRATTASASGQAMADLHMRKWQLLSAVCVERPPVVSAARTPMEEEWAQFLTLQELEQSLLSDHEVKKLVDA